MGSLELKNIAKIFGAVEVLKDINLGVDHGEFVVFVGPSGCGKSTLLRIIAGLEEQSAGQVLIDGEVIDLVPPARRGIAMVFQTYALYPHLTVRGNIGLGLRQAGASKAQVRDQTERAAQMLELQDLLDRRPAQLSGGERQRVAIGRAIVRDPKLFLFDEPLSNLDAALRINTRIEIANLHRSLNTTTVYVTHDQVEAMTLADRIIVLNRGRIEQAGAPLDLYNKPANLFVAGFIGAPRMNLIEGAYAETQGAATLGLRPEHIDVVASGGVWSGTVIHAEHLGADTFIYVDVEAIGALTVRAVGEVHAAAGDLLHLAPRQHLIHRFDANGVRLS
ncbi:MAG: ABC transporter ATP-binding protein [Alphaproteobacteria bacterium]